MYLELTTVDEQNKEIRQIKVQVIDVGCIDYGVHYAITCCGGIYVFKCIWHIRHSQKTYLVSNEIKTLFKFVKGMKDYLEENIKLSDLGLYASYYIGLSFNKLQKGSICRQFIHKHFYLIFPRIFIIFYHLLG